MTLFCVTDVHAHFDILMRTLSEHGFDINNPNHVFLSCGDLLDRGGQTLETLRFVNNLPNDRKILIRGNHEDLIEECFRRRGFRSHDYSNGTVETVLDLAGKCGSQNPCDIASGNVEWIMYRDCLRDYYEIGKYLFVHGWVPDSRQGDWRDGDWSQARWMNGMEEWDAGNYQIDRTILCGHWHCSWGHHFIDGTSTEFNNHYSTNPNNRKADFSPFVKDGIIAFDACTAYSHEMNCIVIEV